MWNCDCGMSNEEGASFCPYCGRQKCVQKSERVTFNNLYVWGVAILPVLNLVILCMDIFLQLDLHIGVYRLLGYVAFGLICGDCVVLKRHGYNLSKWRIASFFLPPSVYLWVRAVKTDKKYGPLITRISLMLLVVIVLVFSLAWPSITKYNKAQAKEEKDIALILNRDIFAFKNADPDIYNTINDIEEWPPYAENWEYGRILNKDCFSDISWISTEVFYENGRVIEEYRYITFVGEHKSRADWQIMFYILGESDVPFAIKMEVIDADGSSTIIDYESFISEGFDAESAFSMADANISALVSFLTMTQ